MEQGLYAKLTISKGGILIRFEYEKAPMTVANFVGLAEGAIENKAKELGAPYYNGLTFHRVVKDFVVQGGDPKGTGSGGPGYLFAQEVHPDLKHDRVGTVAMANAGPNTNGSQFYITHRETPHLDGGYNVFGYVTEGVNLIDQIKQGDKIESVEIIRVGEDAENFDAPKVFAEVQEELRDLPKSRAKKLTEFKENAKKTDSGLMYVIHKSGSGAKPAPGKKVKVHYVGYLEDGSLFDTSIKEIAFKNGIYNTQREPYAPFSFGLGTGQVIKGWDEGIQLLNKGAKATVIIPPNLGYGENGIPGTIPANSNLIFDIELIEFDE